MHIADESLPAGLMLHAFARAESSFPRPLEGKVLLIKGLEATVFRGSPRAQACLSKGAEIIVLSDDGSTVQLTEDVRRRIEALGSLRVSAMGPPPQAPLPPPAARRLFELPEAGGMLVDLVVQVLKPGRSGVVLVWDGTVHAKLQTMERYVPPYSMLALSADDDQLTAHLATLQWGAWISANNVEIRLRNDRLEACLSITRGGRLQLLAEDDARVQDRRQEWANAVRLARAAPPAPSRVLTASGHQDLPVSTLAQVKAAAGPAIFRCRGLRVVCWAPEDVRDLAMPYCQACQRPGTREVWGSQGLVWYSCKHCQRDLDPASTFVYSFCLTLADATSWVYAQVSKADAELFLGLPAVDLYANEAATGQVKARLEALTQKDAGVDCCLQHHPEAGGAVKHRLFDTRMLALPVSLE